jgi:tRNA threonylcarbamoyladenosine biosynthesis protein TsaE
VIKQIIVSSPEETADLATKIGSELKGGECVEFVSDVGGGKTTFIASMVLATGTRDVVSSPTFTVSKIYRAKLFNIYHFDFYRLSDPGLIAEELKEFIDDKKSVVLIEWADSVRDVLPADRIIIKINKHPNNPEARIFDINIPKKLEYIGSTIK